MAVWVAAAMVAVDSMEAADAEAVSLGAAAAVVVVAAAAAVAGSAGHGRGLAGAGASLPPTHRLPAAHKQFSVLVTVAV
jgi:hypothetical protein